MSRQINVTFEISSEVLLNALKEAGSRFNLKLKQDISKEGLEKELSEDISNFIGNQLQELLVEGIYSDFYLECFEKGDEEDEN